MAVAVVTVLSRPGSVSAASLTAALIARDINAGRATSDSVRRTRGDRIIINLGVSQQPARFQQRSVTYSNTTEAVATCADKVSTFSSLAGADVQHVRFWLNNAHLVSNDMRRAQGADGKIVVRHTVNGHSGQGIQIVRPGEPIPNAPLYTLYFRKDAEYRVHVAFGNVILIQQKRRENGREQNDVERLVRTHAHGWIFTIDNLSCDSRGYRAELEQLAVRACSAVGANHCAVDILTRHTDDGSNSVVVEINSNPSLSGNSSCNSWCAAFENWLRQIV